MKELETQSEDIVESNKPDEGDLAEAVEEVVEQIVEETSKEKPKDKKKKILHKKKIHLAIVLWNKHFCVFAPFKGLFLLWKAM